MLHITNDDGDSVVKMVADHVHGHEVSLYDDLANGLVDFAMRMDHINVEKQRAKENPEHIFNWKITDVFFVWVVFNIRL